MVAGAHTVGNNVQFTHQGMAPICRGRTNDVDVDVMRDSGSTSCVVRTNLVREMQKTGTTSLCMLIDGTVKRFPTEIVELDTLSGRVQALCMDDPVHDVIVGNVP